MLNLQEFKNNDLLKINDIINHAPNHRNILFNSFQ